MYVAAQTKFLSWFRPSSVLPLCSLTALLDTVRRMCIVLDVMVILIRHTVLNLASAVARQLLRLYQTFFSLHKYRALLQTTKVKLMWLAFLNTSTDPTAAKSSSAACWHCSSSASLHASLICSWLSGSCYCGFCAFFCSSCLCSFCLWKSSASLLTSRFACCRACLKGPFKHPCSLAWVGSTSGTPTATCLATSCGGLSS